jgi:branched-chain amino acid transport system substrate-binding protein
MEQKSNLMVKAVVWLIIVVLVVFLFIKIFGSYGGGSRDTIKIGVVTALSGPGAVYGEEMKKGVDLALQEINKTVKTPFEVIYEDYKWDPKLALPAYGSLKLKGIRYFILDGSQGVSILAPEVVKDGNVSFVASSITPTYKDGNPLTCRIALTAESYGPALADLIYNKLGKKKVDLLYPSNEQGASFVEEFKKSFESMGGQIVINESYLSDATDFRTQITKIKADKQADTVVVGNYSKSVESMFKQMKDLSLNKQIVSDNWTTGNPSLTDTSLENGAYFIDYKYSLNSEDNSDLTNNFIDNYTSTYGSKPSLQAAQGYNLMKVISKGFSVGANEPKTVADNITKISNYDIVGGKISFNSDCEAQRETAVRQIVDGKVVNAK